MKIAITGGGTGGHLMPALSVLYSASQIGAEVMYIGSQRGLEQQILPNSGYKFSALDVYPLTKLATPSGVKTMMKFWLASIKAKKILDKFQPDIVCATGGYAAAAVVMAQTKRKGRLVIHEQNAIPGRVNLKLGKRADAVCLMFDECAQFFPNVKTYVTGLPLRKESIETPLPRSATRDKFGLKQDLFTILVVGGSQGAQGLNETIISAVQSLPQRAMQWLHICGPRYEENVRQTAERIGLNSNYIIRPFLHGTDMANAYKTADIIICRSGAATLAEIAFWGLPAILVPYPYAYKDHQRVNAEYFTRRGAAEMLQQKNLNAEHLSNIINDWQNEEVRAHISEHAKSLSIPDATQKLIRILYEIAGKDVPSQAIISTNI